MFTTPASSETKRGAGPWPVAAWQRLGATDESPLDADPGTAGRWSPLPPSVLDDAGVSHPSPDIARWRTLPAEPPTARIGPPGATRRWREDQEAR